MDPVVRYFPNLETLSHEAAYLIRKIVADTVEKRGLCRIALSGGNTPKTLFKVLASEEFSTAIHWDKVKLFWVDERCVADDHPDSNFGSAYQTLISRVSIQPSQVRPILASAGPPREIAAMYEDLLRGEFDMAGKEGFPSFDLVLLGMGPDGHTASLFPNSAALEEAQAWVVSTAPPEVGPAVERITLTLPVINNSRNVVFLISGQVKKRIANEILKGEDSAKQYPAAHVSPVGNLYWFINEKQI